MTCRLRNIFKRQAERHSEGTRLNRGPHTHRSQLILVIALTLFAISNQSLTLTQGDQTQTSVFQAYTGLAAVYASGGQAPDVVARLNAAITLTEQAKIRRNNGDLVGAASLDSQADAELSEVLSEIPVAQQNAHQVSLTRITTALALVPVLVITSTFAFYVALRVWRDFERRRLYEMRIIEKRQD